MNIENSQIQDPVSWVGGNMRQHSGSICVRFQNLKKVYKNNKTKKNRAACCWAYTTMQLSTLKYKNMLWFFSCCYFFKSATWFEPRPSVHLPGSRDELKRGDDSHAELTDAQCFEQLQVGVHSPCKASAESMAAGSRPTQLLLCLAAAPDLFGCALVVWRVVEGWAVAHGRARVVRWALVSGRAGPAGWGPLLRLPVWVVAVGALVWVRVILCVQPVVSAAAELLQLPVFTVIVVSVHKHTCA